MKPAVEAQKSMAQAVMVVQEADHSVVEMALPVLGLPLK